MNVYDRCIMWGGETSEGIVLPWMIGTLTRLHGYSFEITLDSGGVLTGSDISAVGSLDALVESVLRGGFADRVKHERQGDRYEIGKAFAVWMYIPKVAFSGGGDVGVLTEVEGDGVAKLTINGGRGTSGTRNYKNLGPIEELPLGILGR